MEYQKLNTLLSKKKLSLCERYEETNNRKFVCFLKVLHKEFSGVGLSKKKAKLEAIKNIIPHLENIDTSKDCYTRTKFSDLKLSPCRLVEYVMRCRKEPSPRYEVKKDERAWFNCRMYVINFEEPFLGRGVTVKDSKHRAALAMIEHCNIGEINDPEN